MKKYNLIEIYRKCYKQITKNKNNLLFHETYVAIEMKTSTDQTNISRWRLMEGNVPALRTFACITFGKLILA